MPIDEEVNDVSQDDSVPAAPSSNPGNPSLRAYRRRMLLAGFAILTLSFLTGIILSFVQWDRGSPFDLVNWTVFNPLGRATYAPFLFAFYLFPITLPVVLVLSVPIYLGMKKKKLWPLPLLGFLSIGLLWLWYITELWKMD